MLDTDIIVVDTETTGLDPAAAKIVEVAAVRLSAGDLSIVDRFECLVDPECEIPPEASAVHHLTADGIKAAGARPWRDFAGPKLAEFAGAASIFCAHNAAYDSRVMYDFAVPWLCTWRLARHLWPDLPSHGCQYLRYALHLKVDTGYLAPHRAMADVLVTAEILRAAIHAYWERDKLQATILVSQLIDLANSPIVVRIFPFGKHKGVPIADVPRDYIAWALRTLTDMDADLRATLELRMQNKGQ